MTTRLISFVGRGRQDKERNTYFYEIARYHLQDVPDEHVETCYVAQALSKLLNVDEVHLLATNEAWSIHGEALSAALSDIEVKRQAFPDGKDIGELRQQFRILRDAMSGLESDDTLLLDITHGFRHQPFFAASALAVMQAAGDLPADTRILYGAFEAGKKIEDNDLKRVPIWDLTTFLFLNHMAFGIATFMHTGHADLLVSALRDEEQRLRKRTLSGERQSFPDKTIGTLIGALERFARDLSCLRVPALTIGTINNGKCTPSSSRRLLQALQAYEKQEKDELIAIRPLLDDMANMVERLQVDTLFGAEGQRVMAELGSLYLKFHRYAEAASLGAEALICRYASGAEGTDAGQPVFSKEAREAAARRCSAAVANRSELDKRNDLLHAGFRPAPKPADTLQDEVAQLVERIATTPRTLFVTRHAGAKEWAARQGIKVDEIVEHLDPATIRPGDVVIGSLPIHLVAEINRRGARYMHLSLNVPPEHRGRELSADDMEKFGARLEEFRVEPVQQDAEAEAS